MNGSEEVWVEAEVAGEPVARAGIAHPMRGGTERAPGHAVEHVADVADERPRHWRRGDPARSRADLQAADVVLEEDRQQTIVGMLADAPTTGIARRRIVEDAEECQRLGGIAVREV